jgi:hypothetical protein
VEGSEGRVGLHVDSTTDVDVTFSSENVGEMAHDTLEGYGVPYELLVGGEAVDFGSEIASEHRLPADSTRLDLPLAVRVGSTANAPAGDYRDRITITVSAR